MRRLIIPSSLLFVVATLCVLPMPSPAGAAWSLPRIICPQQPGSGIVPCCPLPVEAPNGAIGTESRPQIVPCCPQSGTNCCAATACCTTPCTPGSLTIAASPNPSTAGRKVVISGGLTSTPAAGATVALWRELSGQSSFHQVAQTTTDSTGQYKFTLKRGTVNADQQWYVTANGLQSPTLDQQVNALVDLAGLHSVVIGQAMLLGGHVTPSHAGQVVLIEQRKGSQWAVIARPRLGQTSNYGVMRRFTRAGKVALKTVFPGDSRNIRSSSTTLTTTVTP